MPMIMHGADAQVPKAAVFPTYRNIILGPLMVFI